MDVKLIAIDLNGTLLNTHNQISQQSIDTIKLAQEKGIEIAVVTRRAHFNVQSILREAGISAWIIGANGATIHDPTGKLLYAQPIKRQDAKEIIHHFEEQSLYYEVSSNEVIYTPQKGRDLLTIEMFKLKNKNPKRNLREFLETAERQYSQKKFEFISSPAVLEKDCNCYMILGVSFHRQTLSNVFKRFEQSSGIAILQSDNYLIEITHSDVSKGNALRYLSWYLDLSPKNVLAIGDDENDLSMFDYAGKSVAMENAKKGIKSFAAITTLSNNKNGVAYIIQSLI